MMRVIGGKAKGRRLKVPKGHALRPTADRVKEALFNILPHDLSGKRILDLFAGTGNLSIEALSRGASEAILIDSSSESGKAIRENLQRLAFHDRAKLWIAPAFRSLRRLSRENERFDLIFVDPPYEKRWVGKTLEIIAETEVLQDSGIIVVEHSMREPVEAGYGPLVLQDRRRYGSTLLSFFEYRQNIEDPFRDRSKKFRIPGERAIRTARAVA